MRKLVVPAVLLMAALAGLPDLAISTPPARAMAASSVDLHPCPNIPGAECGSIELPMDPRDPSLGMSDVGFLRFPHRKQDLPSLGTIVAVEGGPGYSTIASRWWYRDLYKPLLDRRDLLLMDLRGTGRSEAIDCPALQSYRGSWKRNVALCGRQLGPLSERYGSAFSAADLVAVLDALDIDRIDIYGDSYGTFFAQTFAVRYPERTRTVTLDGAYPIDNVDAWWRDTNRAIADAFRDTCARDRICSLADRDPMDTIARLARRVSAAPIVGTAYNADGRQRSVRVTVDSLIGLTTSAATTTTIYRELVAAARAAMRPQQPNLAPLLRLAAENEYVGGAGDIHAYSEGQATATGCNDYPQLWDIQAPVNERVAEYRAALDALRRDDPHAFAPFAIDDWVVSSSTLFTSCIRWPPPESHVPAKPPAATYPDVPVLVLDGDLDSLTSPEGAEAVADRFPNATFVEVPNSTHVTALGDLRDCTSALVLDFVRTAVVGDASCVGSYPPIRLADRFPEKAAGLGGSWVTRAALVAAGTLGDVLARWWGMVGSHGVGLRGGTFETHGYRDPAFVLRGVRWVGDVAVDGTLDWDRPSGALRARLSLRGGGVPASRLRVSWNTWHPMGSALVVGSVGGNVVRVWVPAP
ncbi:MAG: alpha/beta fold hydrolase [Actinomycetota bacterium]